MVKQSICGYTLIELMVSSLLSLLLLSALFEVYLSVKSSYYLQNAWSQLQENGRFAVNYLNYTVHPAGYSACDSLRKLNENLVKGYSSSHLPAFLSGEVIAGTDVVVIKRCIEIDKQYQFLPIAYFIGDSLHPHFTDQPVLSLYEKIYGHPRQELVSDVENMQITYGVQSSFPPSFLHYLSANQVNDWSAVAGIKIALLLMSDDNVLSKPTSFLFNGHTFMPTDKKLHKEWDTYIAIPNQLNL